MKTTQHTVESLPGTLQIGGIKCDNPHCNYKDMSVKYEEYPDYLNKPCPICGWNLLTQQDYDIVQRIVKLHTNPLLQQLNNACLKLGIPESTYSFEMNGTGTFQIHKQD